MKAKRLTALALAALMTASGTSVALAAPANGNAFDFYAGDTTLYKENEDGELEVAGQYDFAPGDSIYIAVDEDDDASSKDRNKMNIYADKNMVGDKWIDEMSFAWRRAQVTNTAPTKYVYKVKVKDLSGYTDKSYTSTETNSTKRLAEIKKMMLDDANSFNSAVDAEYAATYQSVPNNGTNYGYIYGGKWYPSADAALRNGAMAYSREFSDDGYSEVSSGYVVDKKYYAKIQDIIVQYLDATMVTGTEEAPETIYTRKEDTQYGIYKISNDKGEYTKETTVSENIRLFTITSEGKAQKYWLDVSSDKVVENINALLSWLGKEGSVTAVTDGFVNKAGDWVEDKPQTYSETVWYNAKGDALGGKGDAIEKLNISEASQSDIIKKTDKNNTNGVAYYAENTAKAEAQNTVKAKVNALTASDFTVTEQKGQTTYSTIRDYFVKIDTKKSASTKDYDIYGELYIGRTKSSAEDESVGYTLDVTLTNKDVGNDDFVDVDSDAYIEPGQRAVLSFADDADDVVIEFGDDAWYEFKARGQGRVNFAYNTNFDRDFAYDYDHANIDFINFVAEPTTNKTGTLYIYADEDSYIYEVTSKGAKKINGAYYDDDEGAWVIRTRHLTSYAISDRRLKTIDQMEDDKNSSSSSKPSGSQGSGSGNGNYKPIPDTGR